MTLETATQWMMVFSLVLTRVAGLMLSAPFFGALTVPVKIRALLSLAVAALLTPLQSHVALPAGISFSGMIPMLTEEMMVGVCLGLGAQLMFSAAQVAGQLAGQLGGMQMADTLNPTSGVNAPLFAQLLDLTTLGVFVALGGPGQLLSALLVTFERVPPGQAEVPIHFIHYYVALLASGFELGIRIGGPMMLALCLSMVLLGLMGRVLPQLNVLQVGFNVNAAVMMVSLLLSLQVGFWAVADQFDAQIRVLIEGAIQGNRAVEPFSMTEWQEP
jgi:flagellar biosynthesis protein FliR